MLSLEQALEQSPATAARLRALEKRVAEQQPLMAKQQRVMAEQEQRIAALQARIAWFERQVWGARSERRALEALNLGSQMWLGLELLDVPEEPPGPSTTVREYERKARPRPVEVVEEDSQLRFGPDVPVQEIEVEDEATREIPEDQRELVSETVTYRLAQRSPYVVLKYVKKTWKRLDTGRLVTPRAPHSVLPSSSGDVSFYAHLLVEKFQYHLPLYRQHQRLEQHQIYLSRGTLTRQIHSVLQVLEPIYDALQSSLLRSPILAVDESPTPAGLKPGGGKSKGKMHQGYFWVLYGSHGEVCFVYSPSRSGQFLRQYLQGYEGVLLTDGYAAYEAFAAGHPQILHAQCWAHSRRNFIQAEKVAAEPCSRVLMAIQQLYAVEREAELGSAKLHELRQKKSRPIVETIFAYLEKQIAESIFLPSNAFHKAAQYVLNRREALQVFLDRPDLPLDTNVVERAIRPAVVGRKNWLFHFTEAGARYAAMAYSLIQSCVVAGVDPTIYLIDVLQRVDTHPAQDVHLLTPRLWASHFSANPLTSDALT